MSAPRPSFDFIDARRQQVRAADLVAQDTGLAPDDAARVWRDGEQQGLAPGLALANAADVRAEAERRRVDEITRTSPVLADWIAEKPERLAVAKDDLEGLSTFERWAWTYDQFNRVGADVFVRAPLSGAITYGGQAVGGLGELVDAGGRMVDRGLRAAFGPTLPGDDHQLPWWADPADVARYAGGAIRADGQRIGVPQERQNFATDVTGGVGQLGAMAGQSLVAPQTLFASLLGVGASQQADRARQQGVEGTAAADTAILAGAPATALLERFGLGKLLERVPPKIKNDTARWITDKIVAAAYEGGQEITEALVQDTITAATFDPTQRIGAGALYEGGVAGTSAAIVRTLLGVRSPLRPVVESARDAERIAQLHAAGEASKTLERAPDEVEAFVRQVVDRTPNAPTHVYLDAEALATYFQSASLDPAQEVGQITGDPQAFATALAGGGDVAVPIARYVARATRSPHAEALKDLARLAPDRASNAELAKINVDEVLGQVAPEAPAEATPEQQVAQQVQAQLEAAGVEPSAAAAQAQLLAQRYATRAARRGLGETALQVYEAAKLTIERPAEGPQPVGQRLEQSAARPGEAPALAAEAEARPVIDQAVETTDPAEAGPGAVSIEQGPEGDTRGSPRTEVTVAELRDAFKGPMLFQPADGGAAPRGRIILGRNGSRTIQLLAGADLSTFHHETGHLFLDELVEDAYTPGADPQLLQDLGRLLDWWGVEVRTSDGREAVVAEVSRPVNHEKFARGYEVYLREGKAPSPALAELLARFRTWMIAIYRSLRQLDITLTDEVRGVYDRLLATDDAIAAAQAQTGQAPLEVPPDLRGLVTEAAWNRYREELAAAAVARRQAVEQRLLAAQQREAEAWWQERKAEVQAEVEAEANARADFQALSLLSRGKMPDGSDPPEGLQGLSLSRAALVEQYGERFVVDRLKPLRVYRKEGGLTPDAAALLLGYPNGAALVAALDTMPRPKEWIAGETDRRMREAYPDPLLDGSLPAQALEELHHDRQLALLAAEMGLLATMAGQPMPAKVREQVRALGAAARQRIARMKRRDIRPNQYLVAERKAARLATEAAAKGNFAEALRRKREQTVSAHLYRAATEATAEFDKARDYLARFTRTDKRAALGKAGGSYLEQVDGLLELVEVRQVSGREVERRASLADWVAARAAAGEQIDVPDAVLALTRVTNLRDMPMEQVRGLVDTIKQIDHLARLKTKLMLGAVERDRAEVDAEVAASVRGGRGDRPVSTGDRTRMERFREAITQGLGAYLRPSTLARDLDGFEDSGPVWRHTVGVIQDAINNALNPSLQQAQEQLAGLWRKHYTDAELRQMQTAVHRPQVGGDAWSKARILSLALNWGNAGNREALLSQARKRLTPEQIGALLGTLDARDVQFVNEVWAFVDSFWPQIAETTRRRTGLAPEKVEASPFTATLADGTQAQFAGGYYPLKYDDAGDPKASQDEQSEFWDAIRTGRFAKAQTRNGHTKERVGSGGRAVRLDIGVLGSHVRDVLRDVHLGDAVNYVHHVLQGSEFRGALADTGMLEYGKALELWLRDVATGEMAPRTWWERTGRKLRTNFTASLLGFNVSSALIQPTGFLQTGAALGWNTLGTGARRLLVSPWTGPNAIAARVDAVSPFMRQRAQVSVEAVRKAERALAGKRDSYVMRHAWYMMARTQRIVDLVTWLGAEAKGLEMFDGDVAKARAYADDAVQRAQASGEFSDKSALERGTFGDNVRQSELVKGSTALMSYMIAKGNIVYERTRQTRFRDPRQIGRLGMDLVSLLVIENLLIAVLRGGLPSDEDEDGLADDVALWFAKEGILGLLGTIPVISQSATSLRGYDAQGVIERLSKTGKRVIDAMVDASEGEELTASDAKAAVSLAGMLTGLPAAQTNRTLDAVLANENGEDVAAHEYVMGLRKE